MFSQAVTRSPNEPKPLKKQVEAGRRYDQGKGFSNLQNTLFDFNARLPQTAAPWEGHMNGGLKKLNRNNKSKDIEQHGKVMPYGYRKLDLLDTGALALRQLHGGLVYAEGELEALIDEHGNYTQSGLSPAQLAALLSHMSQLNARTRYIRKHCGEAINMPKLLHNDTD